MQPIHPGYFTLAIAVGGIIFSAGGFYFGTRTKGNADAKEHDQMSEDIKNLDDVKMSATLCTERHIRIDEGIERIESSQENTEQKLDFLIRINGHDNE